MIFSDKFSDDQKYFSKVFERGRIKSKDGEDREKTP